MSTKYLKLKPKTEMYKKYEIEHFEIENIIFMPKNKFIEIYFKILSYDAFEEINNFRNKLNKSFGNDIDIKFKFIINNEIKKENLVKLIEFIINNLKNESIRHQYIFSYYKVFIDDNNIIIELKTNSIVEQAFKIHIDSELKQKINETLESNFELKIVSGNFLEQLEKIEEEKKEIETKIAKQHDEQKVVNVVSNDTNENQKVKNKNEEILIGKKIKSNPNTFNDIDNLHVGEQIVLDGEIFGLSMLNTKSGKILLKFNITNYNDSVSCVTFLKPNESIDISNKKFVRISGRLNLDKYNPSEVQVMVNSVNTIQSILSKKSDNEEEKRVELHAHTNMSEMCTSLTSKELIKRAIDYGHKAVAVTDFGVCYSYPFAFNAASDDFKVIFGIEAYVVDDETKMVSRDKNVRIEDEEYVVFDLETTGFDPYKDKIIEIGAVKLKGKEIIDRYSVLVNPEVEISDKIQELTGITNDMVANERLIDEILPEFLEFSKDATLVAHNAKFDVGFLTQKIKLLNLDSFTPNVIDTLHWSRTILTDLKRHNLKALSNYFGISLDNHHRAVDDAEATANVFIKFLNIILSKGAVNINDIDNVYESNILTSETNNTIILVKNKKGLRDLYELVSDSHLKYYGQKKPRIPKSELRNKRDGLLISSSANGTFTNEGEIVKLYLRGTSREEIEEKMNFYDYIELYPLDNYIELVNNGDIENLDIIKEMNEYLYNVGKSQNKLVVATGDVHYLNEEDAISRKILIYGSGMGYKSFSHDRKLYFRTTKEMLDAFSYLGESISKEIVITNTNKITDEIERIKPIPDGFFPPKIEGSEDQVRDMTYKRAKELYGENLPENLKSRIDRELDAIIGNGFSVLYLISQKLVKKSLDNGYLVGSRGSVGSSIVAYMMGITEVNAMYPHYLCPKCKNSEFMNQEGSGVDLPDKNCPKCGEKYIKDGHAIPFEVFMGFKGDKVPDIDLNFSGEYQGEIHKYTEELFGKDHVFRAGTISTLATKNAFGYVKKYVEENEIKMRNAEILRIAEKCEGARKTTGQHPGGMIVLPKDKSIYEFTPIQRPANDINSNSITTHFDYHVMDEQLVKLDILGHDDPTTIKMLQDLTNVDIANIPLDDKKTLSLFSSTDALDVKPEDIDSEIGSFGIPEFGTLFVRDMLLETKPKTFAELVRISGLSHGTDVWLNNAQDYIRKGVTHLNEVISVRDDIMNYLIDHGIEKDIAFQIMEFVRKGQPSKNKEKWAEYADMMEKVNIKKWYIESCEKIKYMFPKGHAVAYVMMAVRIAYFKVHYPLEFYTAYLSRKTNDFSYIKFMKPVDKLKEQKKELLSKGKLDVKEKGELALGEILIEAHYRGIELLPVDIYKSESSQFKIENGKIRVPLISMDGLGESVAINISEERKKGDFISIEDLMRRTKLNKTVVETLRNLNCLPEISETNQISLFQ